MFPQVWFRLPTPSVHLPTTRPVKWPGFFMRSVVRSYQRFLSMPRMYWSKIDSMPF